MKHMDRAPFIQAIIRTANAEVLAGSHYLMGADGGLPTSSGGCDGLYKRNIQLLNVNKPDSIAIETAKYDNRLCHGRLEKVGGFKMNLGKKENLHYYLDQYCPEYTWSYGLTPRSLDWTTVMIAESCKDRRHFDCIFFVNWVITKALMKTTGPTYDIKQWTKIAPAHVFTKSQITTDEIQDGDIFINLDSSPKHIGFFLKGGMRIHASGADRGVIQNGYSKEFTHVARLWDSYLKWGN
jgi:hypothetical protein